MDPGEAEFAAMFRGWPRPTFVKSRLVERSSAQATVSQGDRSCAIAMPPPDSAISEVAAIFGDALARPIVRNRRNQEKRPPALTSRREL